LVQHLTKSGTIETLKQVQGDKPGLFARPSKFEDNVALAFIANENDASKWHRYEIKRAY
jgi:hypothetical protein